jgi:hypothetical protein
LAAARHSADLFLQSSGLIIGPPPIDTMNDTVDDKFLGPTPAGLKVAKGGFPPSKGWFSTIQRRVFHRLTDVSA